MVPPPWPCSSPPTRIAPMWWWRPVRTPASRLGRESKTDSAPTPAHAPAPKISNSISRSSSPQLPLPFPFSFPLPFPAGTHAHAHIPFKFTLELSPPNKVTKTRFGPSNQAEIIFWLDSEGNCRWRDPCVKGYTYFECLTSHPYYLYFEDPAAKWTMSCVLCNYFLEKLKVNKENTSFRDVIVVKIN